ncbi:MAG TPA: hypothetical protein DCY59_04310 [Micrococcaceae bacterium]|nr:hypothetical protein [Micrococcaceae bacterium]
MTTPEQLGMTRPSGTDLISGGDNAISANALAVAAIYDAQQLENASLKTTTRRVLHQLSMPGNGNLRDGLATRHVRLPLKLPVAIGLWDLTIKNFNEQFGTNYGDLDFSNVFIGKTLKGSAGQLTANFAEQPTNLGPLQVTGSGATRRYFINGITFKIEPNTEYLLSYGYTNPNPATATHMGIGGGWLGTDPSMVGRFQPPVSNAWSANTPLDVYLTLHAPTDIQAIAYLGSSSETGMGSNYPLRDVWGWKHAEANKALPVLIGHSGSTLDAWAVPTRYTWQKLAASFDKADLAYIAAGSNDIAAGYTLEDMKVDATAVAALVRANLSSSIIYANVFPRSTETAPTKVLRKSWNEYLATLPDGAVGALDRTRGVSTDAELMRPELDSGDGTHLTAQGQTYIASAAIVGSVLTPNLNRYTVDQSAGRVVKVWDYLNNREQLIYGDTGERDISALLVNAAGVVRLQRTGGTVHLYMQTIAPATATSGVFLTLPSGFRPSTQRAFQLNTTSAGTAYRSAYMFTSGGVGVWLPATTDSYSFMYTFPTANPWPTTLPGVAVGSIPA